MDGEIITIEQAALTWPERAAQLVIVDQQSYTRAAETLKEIAWVEKQITDHHGPMKKAAKEAHNQAVAAEKRFLDPLMKAKDIIRGAISKWTSEQERIRREAEAKAREEARRKEEDERLAKAAAAEAEGRPEAEVTKILETPVPIAPVVAMPTYNKVEGVSMRETWHAEVIDIKVLCQAVVEGQAPLEAVQANMPLLNSMARTSKSELSIPGVKAVKEIGVTTRL